MASSQTATPEVREAITDLVRRDYGRLLSGLILYLRDFQLAEDSLQDALEAALIHWGRSGLPSSPGAWLIQTARRKAIDRIRRAANFREKSDQIAALMQLDSELSPMADLEPIHDERLRLIFTCCHPALDEKTSVALTLRSVGGLTTDEIARAFVVSPDTMAQRLVRARHKISKAGIGYEVPMPDALPERLNAVLKVLYLIFNEGYAASADQHMRVDLCVEAIRLCEVLDTLCPGEPEVEGLMALLALHHSRAKTRLGAEGDIITLEQQDRALWDRALIDQGLEYLTTALARGQVGAYQLQAAIVGVHAEAPSFADTNWAEIVLIYDELIGLNANPIFMLNRAVAVSYASSPLQALNELTSLAEPLESYQPYYAVRADLLARSGQSDAARIAYDSAISLSGSQPEKDFLNAKRKTLLAVR